MDGYIEMPLNNLAFKELIKIIENPKNLAVLQHCTSGKDRTGLGSALILLLLGVPEEKVIEDYMLSNEYRKGENHRILQIYEKHVSNETIKELIEGILGVKKKFIELSLNKIKDTYGSYETYFLKEYGLTKEKIEFLRNEYLYQVYKFNKYYKLATNDFMSAGGDGYDFLVVKNIKLPNTENPFGSEVFAAMGVLATIGGSIILKKEKE